ncbi:CHAP domain-containing protein [Anaerotardibacter muris]|uniref:CHAP domain-containing protein n=1 Tax=Anaerotardibacter muris TaxID=2941505 RepID=UPI00203F4048|nr:CHAP domain-containing protein [Anaerotardibacter muris]
MIRCSCCFGRESKHSLLRGLSAIVLAALLFVGSVAYADEGQENAQASADVEVAALVAEDAATPTDAAEVAGIQASSESQGEESQTSNDADIAVVAIPDEPQESDADVPLDIEDASDSPLIPEGYGAGWQLIDGTWYYFDAAGIAKTGWLKTGGKWYYLDPADAAMKTGLIEVDGVWYACDASGAMAANRWIQIGTDWYYATASGALKTGWHKSGGKWYWLEPTNNGLMASESWLKDGTDWYYLTASGAMKTGWQLHKSTWYYLNASGAMATGWKKLGGVWYYLDPAKEGAMKTGRYQVDDVCYVSKASGAMASNSWAQVGSDWYYASASGALKTGWHKSGAKWYWLQPDKAGLMASGEWINDGKSDYFMTHSGAMFTGGWLSQGSADGLANGMFFDKQKVIDIAMAEVGYREKATDAQLDSKTANAGSGNHTKYGRDMHAIDPGTMEYADMWCDAFVDWCFVQAFGVENARGLLGGAFNDYTPVSAQLFKDQKSWYTSAPQVGDQVFFQSGGQINHTGIVYAVSNGKIYTVEGNTSNCVAKREYALSAARIVGYGRPLYNNRGDDGKFVAAKEWCYLDSSGARASGWVKSQGNWYYFDPSTGLMQRGKKVIDGKTYSFNSSGVMKTGWAQESSKWYYYDSSGAMQKDAWVGDYYVGSDGVMATNKWIGDRYVDATGKYDPTKQKA